MVCGVPAAHLPAWAAAYGTGPTDTAAVITVDILGRYEPAGDVVFMLLLVHFMIDSTDSLVPNPAGMHAARAHRTALVSCMCCMSLCCCSLSRGMCWAGWLVYQSSVCVCVRARALAPNGAATCQSLSPDKPDGLKFAAAPVLFALAFVRCHIYMENTYRHCLHGILWGT